jgi:hypothetical protein
VQPEAAIYALIKGAKMVAQAFVWRSVDGTDVVFDSIEALRNADVSVVVEAFAAAAQQIVGRFGIRRVLIPTSCGYGFTSEVKMAKAIDLDEVKTPKTAFPLSYSDAGSHCVVLAVASKKDGIRLKKPMPSPEAAVQSDEAVNVLQEDSGVFCEHCDAEVHPAAEICPVCGEDISEWVEDEAEEAENA